MPEIRLEHITKRWGKFYGVDDLNLVIENNAFVTLLGPSGCGKTTTLRMIAGLETPTSGRITIGDTVVFDSELGINIPANKRKVGFLFQNYALWPNMTVYQNISFGLSNIKEEMPKISFEAKNAARLAQILKKPQDVVKTLEECRDKNGKLYYLYSTQSDDAPTMKGSTVYLDPAEVLHIPGLGFDGLVGYSPIAMAKNAIGMAIACEEYGAKFFANGAAPGGVLEHPGTIKDPQRVRESWQSTFGGSGNANKIAVLEEGMKYTPIGISPEQAQFLETRKFQINEIARIFRVPPHMVGDLEKSSFSNIEQQSLEFVKYTLDPWVIRWEQSIQRSLLSKDEKAVYFVKFNLEGLLRGDYQSRMNGYAIGRQNGWMSANDIRELENLDRIPAEDGGDLYLINGNMLPLQNAGAFANINTDNGKEEKSDEEVLELEKQDSDKRGDAGTDPRENPVLKRHDR